MKNLNEQNQLKKPHNALKLGLIGSYVARQLDKDQALKRYLFYNTENPTGGRSIDYLGQEVIQPDITTSLINRPEYNGNIFATEFDAEMKQIQTNQIYVYPRALSVYGTSAANISLYVVVLVPEEYDFLAENKRRCLIADRVEDILNGNMIVEENANEEFINVMGNLEFGLKDIEMLRLSKTNSTQILRMRYDVKTNPMRI